MTNKFVWIGVGIVALFGIWWIYRVRNTQTLPSQPTNFGSEGRYPANVDPQIADGLRTTSVFNDSDATWSPSSLSRQIN